MIYFKRKRWKRPIPVLISFVAVCIFLIAVYKYYVYKTTIKHPVFFPILPLAERRLRRGGAMIYDKAKNEKLPGLELNLHVLNEPSESLSPRSLEFNFFNSLEHKHVTCHKTRRLGTQHDGGWTACMSPPFTLKQPCLVYSFGIGEDWRFEDEVDDMFHCQVMAFDPSINKTEHNRSDSIWFRPMGLGSSYSNVTKWPTKTFQQILTEDGNSNVTIDLLKFDIEFMEWEVIQDLCKGGNSLQNVKQLVFEMHLRNPLIKSDEPIGRQDFIDRYRILKLIEAAGFRRFGHRVNQFCYYKSDVTGEQRSRCYDLFYLNMKFIRDEHLRKGKGNELLNLA